MIELSIICLTVTLNVFLILKAVQKTLLSRTHIQVWKKESQQQLKQHSDQLDQATAEINKEIQFLKTRVDSLNYSRGME